MTRERWEVRATRRDGAIMVPWVYRTRAAAHADAVRHSTACTLLYVVRVRTFAVVSVWAWREPCPDPGWWCGVPAADCHDSPPGYYDKGYRTLYPTRAAALAARPSAEAVLVRIRRRVRK